MFKRVKRSGDDDVPQRYDEDEDFDAFVTAPPPEKHKEFYVKKEDLIREIKRYKDSIPGSPDGRRCHIGRARHNDNEDLHTLLDASQVLPGTATEMSSWRTRWCAASRTRLTRSTWTTRNATRSHTSHRPRTTCSARGSRTRSAS